MLNVNGYFDHLLAFMDCAVTDTFVREEHRSMLLVHEDPAELLNLFNTYQPPTLDKAHWILSINNL
jgi:predicted Rossmann-fold nucleotide-binding protein